MPAYQLPRAIGRDAVHWGVPWLVCLCALVSCPCLPQLSTIICFGQEGLDLASDRLPQQKKKNCSAQGSGKPLAGWHWQNKKELIEKQAGDPLFLEKIGDPTPSFFPESWVPLIHPIKSQHIRTLHFFSIPYRSTQIQLPRALIAHTPRLIVDHEGCHGRSVEVAVLLPYKLLTTATQAQRVCRWRVCMDYKRVLGGSYRTWGSAVALGG